jgi:hypothetical protein
MRALRVLAGLLFLVGTASPAADAQAPEDSTSLISPGNAAEPLLVPSDSTALPSPRGALVRALLAPGLGQVYAGQPVKTPFVVGALGGLIGFTVYLNGRYVRYRHAHLYVSREASPNPDVPNPDNEFAEFFDDWIETGARDATTTRALRDDFRRNRDLAILGSALVYVLQAVDAYVAAQLADFDVSEDLSIHVVPTTDGPAAVLTLRF